MVYIISFIISILIFKFLKEEKNCYLKIENKISFKKRIFYILTSLGVSFSVSIGLSKLFEVLKISQNTSAVSINIDSSSFIKIILSIVIFAFIPAILEEILFRKMIYGMLKKNGKIFAIILSSLIFGLIHMYLIQSIFAFIFGVVLCLIYEKTKNIKLCILIHTLNNGLAVLLEIQNEIIINTINIFIYICILSLIVFIIKYLIKNKINIISTLKADKDYNKNENIKLKYNNIKKKFLYFTFNFYTVSIILFIIVMMILGQKV